MDDCMLFDEEYFEGETGPHPAQLAEALRASLGYDAAVDFCVSTDLAGVVGHLLNR